MKYITNNTCHCICLCLSSLKTAHVYVFVSISMMGKHPGTTNVWHVCLDLQFVILMVGSILFDAENSVSPQN